MFFKATHWSRFFYCIIRLGKEKHDMLNNDIRYIAVTKPLQKHRYFNCELKEKAEKPQTQKTNTSLLLEKAKERDESNKASVLLTAQSVLLKEVPTLAENVSPTLSAKEKKKLEKAQKKLEKKLAKEAKKEAAKQSEPAEKKNRFRKLKKPTLNLFDEVVDEAQIENQRIENLLNQDGYYNEVVPSDYDVEYKKKRGSMALPITLTIFAIILTILYILYKLGGLYVYI